MPTSAELPLFSIAYRQGVRDFTLDMAVVDERVIAGAEVGSLALGNGDRWSDLDLTFAVAEGHSIHTVLEDWTRQLAAEFNAAHLFDLPSGPAIYRVFLLPGCLQFDLSFAPAHQFGARGPKFRLLFGQAVPLPLPPLPSASELFGYAVHHVLRARFCLARGRAWQAAYWINSGRDYALNLACLRKGLPAVQGRGFDALPPEVLARFEPTLIASLDRQVLLAALAGIIAALLDEAEQIGALTGQVAQIAPQLQVLARPWEG
ncbi:MAG: nucleotidyltransferase domain-containing protein [Anaerolineales bacterium]